jgi:hypothetical protein
VSYPQVTVMGMKETNGFVVLDLKDHTAPGPYDS